MPYRVHVFSEAYQEVCRHLHSSDVADRPAPQLTATQDNLLRWTLQVYSLEAKALLEAYSARAAAGTHGLPASREMANSVHHFAHGLEHTGLLREATEEVRQRNAVLATRLRQQVYSLMLQNLNAQRKAHVRKAKKTGNIQFPFPSDWPEHVKTVATAGQHLLTVGE